MIYLGLNSLQRDSLFEKLDVSKSQEIELRKIHKLTPLELISMSSFSSGISVWLAFESVLRNHHIDCSNIDSEFLTIEIPSENFDIDSVENADFSVRTLNVLRKEGIKTLSDLNEYSRNQLLDLRNMGLLSVTEIEKLLESRGFDRFVNNKVQSNSPIGANTPIERLDLSARVLNALIRSQITNLGQLMELSIAEIKDIRTLGDSAIAEILELQEIYYDSLIEETPTVELIQSNKQENFIWGTEQLLQEISKIMQKNETFLEIKVNELSLGEFDFINRRFISQYLQSESISLRDLLRGMQLTISTNQLSASIINLVSATQVAIEKHKNSQASFHLTKAEHNAFLEYQKLYEIDSIDLFEIDNLTSFILGLNWFLSMEVLQGAKTFFDVIDLTNNYMISEDLPWEMISKVKTFFEDYGSFPNLMGLVIAALNRNASNRQNVQAIFQKYLEFMKFENAARDSLIVMLRIERNTLDQIGTIVGLTRERVRQIIKNASPILEIVVEKLVIERNSPFSPYRDEVFIDLFQEYGAVYLSELAISLNLEEGKALEMTPRKFHKFIIDKSIPFISTSQWSREDVIFILKKAGTYYFPLKTSDYEYLLEIGEISGPSVPYIYKKYGSWTEMCISAGVEPAPSLRGEYVLLWNEDELVSFLQRYLLDEGTTGTASGYDEWRERQGDHVPSGALIRNQFEKWSDAKRIALEGIRISKGKEVEG